MSPPHRADTLFQVLRDITPKKRGILEESRQQAVVSPPHRTRFVPAPAGKASSLPQQGALPSDAQPGSTPQSSADEPARLQQATGSNENKEQPVPLHQASPFQSPARTASVGRIGSEEMRQAEALVQATRGPASCWGGWHDRPLRGARSTWSCRALSRTIRGPQPGTPIGRHRLTVSSAYSSTVTCELCQRNGRQWGSGSIPIWGAASYGPAQSAQ